MTTSRQDLLTAILEGLPLGVVVMGDGGLLYVNLPARRLLGWQDRSLPMHDPWRLFGDGGMDEAGMARLRHGDGGPLILRRSDGALVQVWRTPLDTPFLAMAGSQLVLLAEVTGAFWGRVHEDRGRRLAAMAQVAGRINEAVRSQLGGIQLCAAMLARELATDDANRPLAEEILAAVRNMEERLGGYLAWTGIPGGRPQPLTVKPWLREVLTAMGDGLHGGGRVALATTLHQERILADPTLLELALRHGVDNARQAGAGTIRLEARRLVAAGRPLVEIGVADTGEGIDPALLERVFDPGFTTRPGRAGMGLAVVHLVAEAHGGMVHLESRPGEGTVLRLLLPSLA